MQHTSLPLAIASSTNKGPPGAQPIRARNPKRSRSAEPSRVGKLSPILNDSRRATLVVELAAAAQSGGENDALLPDPTYSKSRSDVHRWSGSEHQNRSA